MTNDDVCGQESSVQAQYFTTGIRNAGSPYIQYAPAPAALVEHVFVNQARTLNAGLIEQDSNGEGKRGGGSD
jgi:hypothetical protein